MQHSYLLHSVIYSAEHKECSWNSDKAMGWMIQDFNPGRNRRYLSLLHNIWTGSGPQEASYSVGMKGFVQTLKWQWCEADSSLHLIIMLRKSGALPLLILHAFKNWTGATSPFHILYHLSVEIRRNFLFIGPCIILMVE